MSERTALEQQVAKERQQLTEELRMNTEKLQQSQQEWEVEKTRLTGELQQSQELLSTATQEGELKVARVLEQLELCCGERDQTKQSLVQVEGERNNVKKELAELQSESRLKAAEIERLVRETDTLHSQVQQLTSSQEEERQRVESRYQQAQSAIGSLRAQLEKASIKARMSVIRKTKVAYVRNCVGSRCAFSLVPRCTMTPGVNLMVDMGINTDYKLYLSWLTT